LWIADEPAAFAKAVIEALGGNAEIAASGRRYVAQNHDWARNLAALDRLLNIGARVPTSRASVGSPDLRFARAAE
jgi:Mn-containing catalase